MSFRLRFFAGEAISSLRNNFATTLAATVTVLIVLFWLGVFVSLGSYMYSKLEQVRSDVQVSVYLQDGVRPAQIDVLRARLQHNPAVQKVTYISKADAIKEMRRRLGKDADILRDTGGTNFLPAKLDVKLKDPDQASQVA